MLQLLLSGVSAEEHLEGTIADPELLMEVRLQPAAGPGLCVSSATVHGYVAMWWAAWRLVVLS